MSNLPINTKTASVGINASPVRQTSNTNSNSSTSNTTSFNGIDLTRLLLILTKLLQQLITKLGAPTTLSTNNVNHNDDDTISNSYQSHYVKNRASLSAPSSTTILLPTRLPSNANLVSFKDNPFLYKALCNVLLEYDEEANPMNAQIRLEDKNRNRRLDEGDIAYIQRNKDIEKKALDQNQVLKIRHEEQLIKTQKLANGTESGDILPQTLRKTITLPHGHGEITIITETDEWKTTNQPSPDTTNKA